MRQVAVFGKPIEYYRAIIKGNVHYFFSLPIPPELEQSGYKWLDDKFVLFKRLSKRGVNVPKTIELFTWGKALKHFPNFNKPVIIKPKSGSRSRHTTTQIKTLEELRHGYNLAKEITPTLVMQEHLFGSVYRATVIQNKLVGFFQGNPAKIAGDGVTTIKELIAQQNKNRNDRLSEILINNDLLSFIERQAYNLESILPQGQDLYLSGKIGRMYGGHTKEMLPEVHLKLHEIMRRAGEAVSAPVVGFDLIMEDPTQDPDAQRWGIIECNSLPFIDLHYFPLEGTPINLAKNVWDLWNK